jgi:hypothetical protein
MALSRRGRRTRTAKSCGSGTSTPVSSLRRQLRRRRRQTSPSSGEITKQPLKPFACGNAGFLRWTRGDYARVLCFYFAREAAGASSARHSPRPLFRGRESMDTSRKKIMRRECGGMPSRHCEEHLRRSNPSLRLLRHGLLRCARNDESTARPRHPFHVVPANAGTHNPRTQLLREAVQQCVSTPGPRRIRRDDNCCGLATARHAAVTPPANSTPPRRRFPPAPAAIRQNGVRGRGRRPAPGEARPRRNPATWSS